MLLAYVTFIENLETSASQVAEILAQSSNKDGNSTATTVITGNYFDELLPTNLNHAWSRGAQYTISRLQPGCQHYVINGVDHRMIYSHPQEVSQPIKRIIKRIKHSLNSND